MPCPRCRTPLSGGRVPEQAPAPLLGAPRPVLASLLSSLGQPAYRADQIDEWVYQRFETDFEQMTNLPAELRRSLADAAGITAATLDKAHTSRDGTIKFVIRLADGLLVESVMIPDGDRRTACISSQVGCPIGCVFCASGLDGVQRNLTLDEILAQFLLIQRHLAPKYKLSNVVFMGMGEPLLNLKPLIAAIRALNNPERFNFGARRIIVSTVGISGKIPQLAETGLQFGLALSLHAPTDELRNQLVPYPQRATLADLLADAEQFRESAGRTVTIEYVLLAHENDQPQHARQLAKLIQRRPYKVNLIPWNPVARIPQLARPLPDSINRFHEILEGSGIPCTIRRQRGDDIAAACGQLARSS